MSRSISSSSSDDSKVLSRIVPKDHPPKISIFDTYAKIFRLIIVQWIPRVYLLNEEQREKELNELILPSNIEWRHGVYYKLVELQRERDVETNDSETTTTTTTKKAEEEPKSKNLREHEWINSEKLGRVVKAKLLRKDRSRSLFPMYSYDGSMTEACIEPGWRIEDILLAAKILEKGETRPQYANEAEMRRVFGLVYDVLRYRNVLNYVLQDVGFWSRNHGLKGRERIVWLLLYDMQGRKFSRRGDISTIKTRERIFKKVGLKDIEDALLDVRTHLAASVSRLRIAGSALTLDKLLPRHLRTSEGIVWAEESSVASGWINVTNADLTKTELIKELSTKLGLQLCQNCEVSELDEDTYTFDPFCPKMLNLHERAREKVACSSLVREHRFIFLERSLCLGAAAVAHAMRIGRLCGPVVLTHAVAPRHTGYLAELLAGIEGAGRLLAFGTGDRRYEHEAYLNKLGITLQQCRVFSEKYTSSPPSLELERATVVLATPPSSYVGVKDIVDLVVARDGDTNLLESLTENNDEISQSRAVLTEQLATLKYALTRPNVQFLIYEVHSVLSAETTSMVDQVVNHANQMATEKYIREHLSKKKVMPSKEKQGVQITVNKASGKNSSRSKIGSNEERFDEAFAMSAVDASQRDEDEVPSSAYRNFNVPNSDLFEVRHFNDIYGDGTLEPGCFLSIIKRKEMMQFDSLFMIKVAESKGLFGDNNRKLQEKELKPIAILAPTAIPTCTNYSKHKTLTQSSKTLTIPEYSRKSVRSTEFTLKDSNEMKWRMQKIKVHRVLPAAHLKIVPQKYRTRSFQKQLPDRLFLLKNVQIQTSRDTIPSNQDRSDALDILDVSEIGLWNERNVSFQSKADNVSFKSQEKKRKVSKCSSSSTVLRKSALIRATQRTSFIDVLKEHDKELRLPIRVFTQYQGNNNTTFGRVLKRQRGANPTGKKWQVPFISRLDTLVEHAAA